MIRPSIYKLILSLLFVSFISCESEKPFTLLSIYETEGYPSRVKTYDNIWNQGIEAYKNQDFITAYQLWDRLSVENNTKDTLIYFRALSAMQVQEWDLSIGDLNRVDVRSVYHQKALLYKAFCYDQKGQERQSKRVFKLVRDKDLVHYNSISKLIEK